MRLIKTVFCLLPRRLAKHLPENRNLLDRPNIAFIGWVWLRKANLVNNLNHGWVAFLEDNPQLQKPLCEVCSKKFATCYAKGIVFGVDRDASLRGADADKVIECDACVPNK